MGRTLQGVERVNACSTGFLGPGRPALTGFDRIPEILLDNPQIRNVVKSPFGFRVEARDAFAGVGVLDIAQAVPHEAPNIEFVIENTRAAFPIAIDR
ncbi:hypothetical protein AD928_00690 [Acetobacter cerevisiae]|uniref:Uncharacterized protein n=1 Tax=Acetobacter cerevisiae TaxID=178900 RepID=A0A149QZD4_9PROT|nr:hypothetical protein AD928_00690 [Acetobacter cerevisiae]